MSKNRSYELLDHKSCCVGGELRDGLIYNGVTNCSKCHYLEGCRAGFEGFEVGEKYRDKQTFSMVNPNAI